MKKTILSLTLLLALSFMAAKVDAQISVGLSVHIAPPAIPVYTQPPCPVDGYLWVPGYWAWDDDAGNYYWVPGYWSAPPTVGFLWTPGYWGFVGGIYRWNAGYWGPHVGYYGGINYGCGYGGSGYYGGEWYGGHFRYNTAVTRVNTTVIHNTYINRTVVHNVTVNRVSYNGGAGGVQYRPNGAEQAAMRENHVQHTDAQVQHQQAAMHDRSQFANVNHGRPGTMAMARPATGGGLPHNNAVVSRPGNPAGNMSRPANVPHNNPTISRPQVHQNQPRPQMQHNNPRPMPQGQPHGQPHGGAPQGQPHSASHVGAPRGGGEPHGGGGGEHRPR